jgi:CheY-like chemotaxis protein
MLVAIVDDDPDFCELIDHWLKAFTKRYPAAKSISFRHFANGDALIDMLRERGAKRVLVLLDLDLHGDKRAGIKALSALKQSSVKHLREVPIVIYSNSDDPHEVEECYRERANSYVWKGLGHKQKQRFLNLVRFWIETASLPARVK